MTLFDQSPQRRDLAHWRTSAREAAAEAATFIAERAKTRHAVEWQEKSATDFVSDVDIGAEERINRTLLHRIPEIRLVGEELGPTGDTSHGLVAIVDPLDGTTNFLHGYPAYCVSICIALDGVPLVGVVHDVARGGVYCATAGGGAFIDDEPLRVSSTQTPARALVGTGFPFKSLLDADQFLAQMRTLMPLVAGVRRAGAAALDLCDVARGRLDAFWELTLAPWDIAAGLLIVREAGGRATTLRGTDAPLQHGPVVASNTVLHDWMLEQLARS